MEGERSEVKEVVNRCGGSNISRIKDSELEWKVAYTSIQGLFSSLTEVNIYLCEREKK